MDARQQSSQFGNSLTVDDLKTNGNSHLTPMERSNSTNTTMFRDNYDELLKEVLDDENSEQDDEDLLHIDDIDLNAATADLPDELRAALEDRALGDKYLADLKTYLNHRRSHSLGSTASMKGDYSTPNTPLQASFPRHSQPPKPLYNNIQRDPLSKILETIPYHTRLVNGVQSLTVLEQKFHALRIPELDLPTVSDSIIQSRLDDMYRIQDELNIHLHGGPLMKMNKSTYTIGEQKRRKVNNLLDELSKEIGLYEEFVKRAHYLSLESILNESDDSSVGEYYMEDYETFDTGSSLNHFDSSSEISKASPGTPSSSAAFSPTPFSASPKTPRRITSNPSLQTHAEQQARSVNGALLHSRLESSSFDSQPSSEMGSASDGSPSVSQPSNDPVEPWEAFKWTALKKISDQLYSEDMRRHHGLASVLAVSGVIAIGTTRSLVFVYDYSQNLKCILGDSARAVEIGSVTSLSISADHTTVVCGHSQGYILVWDITKPAQPIRVIEPISPTKLNKSSNGAVQQQQTPRKEGHVKGAAILHVGFVGVKKSEIVSGDDQGMAFYHVLYKVVMVNAVDTTRILGRYQNLSFSTTVEPAAAAPELQQIAGAPPKPRRPSTVFSMQPLPLGQIAHPAESFGLVALLTPYKMIIVGLKPTPQTQYKFLKPKPIPFMNTSSTDPLEAATAAANVQNPEAQKEQAGNKPPVESLAGCLAWLPATKSDTAVDKPSPKDKHAKLIPSSDPMLAFTWGNHLFILRVGVESNDKTASTNRGARNAIGNKSKRGNKLEFIKHGEWKCRDVIVGMQWINRQILALITPNEEMILFDPRNMMETERASIRSKELVYHDRFNAPLEELVTESMEQVQYQQIQQQQQQPLGMNVFPATLKTVEMAYYHSLRAYKGKLFLLGLNRLYIGTLLSWADRIIALVRAGDFLEGIELATSFYNGSYTQKVVGLPEDEQARKKLVGDRLKELLDASLNYTFSSTRTYDGMVDDFVGNGTVMFHDLANGCIKACLSMNSLDYLFDVAYDQFAENNVRGVFLEVLAPMILQDKMHDIPPAVMKDLVDHCCSKHMLAELEQIIWHVDPQCLDIDQIVSVCHREGLYEAMIYVWNRSMDDYVSPVVEMLKVVKHVLKDESTRIVVPQFDYHGDRTRMDSMGSMRTMEPVPENEPRKNAEKLFDYFRHVLRGRTYPDGLPMPSSKANEARSAVYSFVFSGRCAVWPRVGGKLVLTVDDDDDQVSEPTYPYLRLLLRFNTKKFLEALEVAFEDPWLNGGDDILTSTVVDDDLQGKVISRQIIVNTLLDVLGSGLSGTGLMLPPPRPKQSISTSTVLSNSNQGPTPPPPMSRNEDHDSLIQLYIFIASNLHKYTTFIFLPLTTLHNILIRLAEANDPDTRHERQAAVQSLLSVYKPKDPDQMILYYEDAGFWQVLEDVYRRERKYGKLVEANLKDDERRDKVFDCVFRLLDERSELSSKKRDEVKTVFMVRISQFVEIDGEKSAQVVEMFFNGKHEEAIRRLEEDAQEFENDDESRDAVNKRVFLYLRGLLEPFDDQDDSMKQLYAPPKIPSVDPNLHERYIELMCRFDPSGVYDYLNTKLIDNVNLNHILKSCEEYGVIDAVVWIMEKSGDTQGALDKMLAVAKEKMTMVLNLVRDHNDQDTVWTFEEQSVLSSCLVGLSGVLRVGIRLCENSSRSIPEDAYEQVESLWFQLLDSYVESSIEMHNALRASVIPQGLYHHIVFSFKSFVQTILTHLLQSTSPQKQGTLPRLLSRLIDSQARCASTFADFRDIFKSILDTYKYEGKLLEMTNRLFERDLFAGVNEMVKGKGKGWKPRRGACEECGQAILDLSLMHQPLAWGLDDEDDDEDQVEKESKSQGSEEEDKEKKDEGKEPDQETTTTTTTATPEEKDVVVFHCGHVYHKRCLEPKLKNSTDWRCILCHSPEQELDTPKKQDKGKERAT